MNFFPVTSHTVSKISIEYILFFLIQTGHLGVWIEPYNSRCLGLNRIIRGAFINILQCNGFIYLLMVIVSQLHLKINFNWIYLNCLIRLFLFFFSFLFCCIWFHNDAERIALMPQLTIKQNEKAFRRRQDIFQTWEASNCVVLTTTTANKLTEIILTERRMVKLRLQRFLFRCQTEINLGDQLRKEALAKCLGP